MSTFTKVVVGDDGQDGGADALALARALAPDAELVLVTTYPWDPTPSRAQQPAYGALLHDDAVAALERRREQAGLPAGARAVAIADASPGRALHHVATDEEADLVVVGSARHGAVGRLLLGSVGRAVLYGAPCPVAVAPRGFADRAAAPSRIGVAFDGGAEARRALDVALDVARDLGAAVTIRQVVAADLLPAVAGYPVVNVAEFSRDLLDNARSRLDALVAELPDAGVEVTADAVLGTTAERLAELSDETDLLVTGSRGYGPLRRVMLGSTADRLIHRAPCPVLVVPRGEEE
jgi:nucleotide-binding universal stress UspA family protein